MASPKLSVNINKIATLRNARGGDNPNLVSVALNCERFGAQGITVHPRPDERHIRYQDVLDLKPLLTTEFNIEGKPNDRFLELVQKVQPAQCTLVPDADNAITSNAGWDTLKHKEYLKEIISFLQSQGIRTSIFVDPVPEMIIHAAETGTNRVELYTEGYARAYADNREAAVKPYLEAARLGASLGLEINAGHDLDLHNLRYLRENMPELAEVSIGHALICDALYFGLENTIQLYLRQLV
ncbi:pyridoxine 5'-phosphate synthase [Anseongella ginsenosidimutans]|uniref:Pyridoxine 5'-phosphate synthase n=1 Tax=Anseongella ginsenosidimutans TaxID=496056 RepID=A0A4R3KYR3_9SPHI|nr:pyridoxine 5'-phosphate synthase [Anseongella ginsenosidimutans]QEC50912.1 pyridoxine 5'-phosphate synthase [Anseongella ginsenosidimutans]TCS90454.1 pyridoxine 5'-phosphate synthase [Anseongella ginsenosidimutans]